MNRFLKKILLFFMVLSGLFLGSYLLLVKHVSKGKHFAIPKDVHSLIMGHSHSACTFNDSLIDGFYNLSQTCEGYPYTYFKTKKLIENNAQIKNVFVEYTNNQVAPWSSIRIHGDYIETNIPRLLPTMEKRYALKMFYKSRNMQNISNAITNSYKNYAEFALSGKENYVEEYWHTHITPKHIFDDDTTSKKIDFKGDFIDVYSVENENLTYLVKLKNYCKEKGINFYLIRSPLPSHVKEKNEFTFLEIKNSYFKDTPFLDFRNSPIDINLFADHKHLNVAGSNYFSKIFNEHIAKNKSFDEKSVAQMIELMSAKN